jgi:hypothetical protein
LSAMLADGTIAVRSVSRGFGISRLRRQLFKEYPISCALERHLVFLDAFREGRVEDGRGSLGALGHRPVSHPRSSNRTCRFPASGFPTGFTAMHATGPLWAGVEGTERRVLDE